MPAVFQASHHSVSATYGIVCKIKRNCTLQIWDHAISWRETNLYLSSAMCTLPPFIRNALLGLMKLTSTLTLHHADQILPCAGKSYLLDLYYGMPSGCNTNELVDFF